MRIYLFHWNFVDKLISIHFSGVTTSDWIMLYRISLSHSKLGSTILFTNHLPQTFLIVRRTFPLVSIRDPEYENKYQRGLIYDISLNYRNRF